ncbi:hypothetical protein FAI41_04060 [Acetobacteraceae bacterium]|nr:hypothetical protein FAI41_04060 [Acetobacteraceae bacterium]
MKKILSLSCCFAFSCFLGAAPVFIPSAYAGTDINVGTFAGDIIAPNSEKLGKITKKGEIIDLQGGVPIATITPMGQVTSFEGTVLGTVSQGDRLAAYKLAKQPIMKQVSGDLSTDSQLNTSASAGDYAGTVTTSENKPIASIAPNGAITDLTSHQLIGYVNEQGQVTALNDQILGTVGPGDKFAAYNLARNAPSANPASANSPST